MHFTQREAAEQAQALTSAKITDKDEKRAINEAIAGFRFDSPYGKDVKRMLGHGIGLHHAGLLPKYRLLVEQLAQQGLLKVICGTDTLGVGVNVPIRTVLFTKLSKFDGRKVSLLSVRDFKQIAGRAGRKGFDVAGSVVVQAPEHVIENKKLEAKAAQAARRRARRRSSAGRSADHAGLRRLERGHPRDARREPARDARIALPARPRAADRLPQGPARCGRAHRGGQRLRPRARLIERCHEPARRKPALRREAARCFRSLRQAGVVERVRAASRRRDGPRQPRPRQPTSRSTTRCRSTWSRPPRARPVAETTPSTCSASTEAILENPRAILIAQERKAKDELMAELKAERVPYEERIEKLEKVTGPSRTPS